MCWRTSSRELGLLAVLWTGADHATHFSLCSGLQLLLSLGRKEGQLTALDSYMVAVILGANLVEKDTMLRICCNLHSLLGILLTHLYKWAYLKDILRVLSFLEKKGYKLKPRCCHYDIFFFCFIIIFIIISLW